MPSLYDWRDGEHSHVHRLEMADDSANVLRNTEIFINSPREAEPQPQLQAYYLTPTLGM